MRETHEQRGLRGRRLAGPVLTFRLGAEDDALRAHGAGSEAGRTAKTLLKQGPFRLTLVLLTQGTTLEPHEVSGPVTLHCLRGCLRVTTEEATVDLLPGDLIALDAGVVHTAGAVDDCAVLITLALV